LIRKLSFRSGYLSILCGLGRRLTGAFPYLRDEGDLIRYLAPFAWKAALGLDVGDRRVGVAVTDARGLTEQSVRPQVWPGRTPKVVDQVAAELIPQD
jgi:hypothetical protein